MHPPHYLVEISAFGVVSRDMPGWEVNNYPAVYGDRKFAYPHVAPGEPMFSRAVRIGNLILCTGMGGHDENTYKIKSNNIVDQVNTTLDNVRMTLAEAGGSLSNLVKTTVFYKDIKDLPLICEAELEYYKKHAPLLVEQPPSRHLLQTELHQSESLVEFESIGFIT